MALISVFTIHITQKPIGTESKTSTDALVFRASGCPKMLQPCSAEGQKRQRMG